MNTFAQKYHKGFVILFAVVIAAGVLLLTMSIFSISLKQSVLSSQGREAHIAFMAADSGIECALLADKLGILGTGQSFSCANQSVQVSGISTPITFSLALPQSSCAVVSIEFTGNTITRAVSQGYNLCNGTEPDVSPRLVERVLQIRFGSVTPNSTPITPSPSPLTPSPNPITPSPSPLTPSIIPLTP